MPLTKHAAWGAGWLRRMALALGIWLAAAIAWAGPPPWPDVAYSYYAEDAPIARVLADFANGFNLTLALEPNVQGSVNGRFTSANPTEFISRLGGVYGFSWYTFGGTLYVSKTTDSAMRSIRMPPGSGNLRGALTTLGVVEPRFGWAELPDQGIVIVSGPPSYLRLVETTLQQMPGSTSRQEVRVFRLKYASATDRTINWRERSIVQPGLADVLARLIGGRAAVQSGAGESFGSRPFAATPAIPLPDKGSAGSAGQPGAADKPEAAAREAAAADSGRLQVAADPRYRVPSIQADPRLNAIIVQDQPERMPVYEKLIAQLDVPSPLIEIEAMIVDVNSDRANDLGINWALSGSGNSLTYGVPGSLTGPGTISFNRVGPSTLITNGGLQLLAQLHLLETRGDARVQSRPSVLTIDNIGALLDLSETFYVRVQGERVANLTPVTAGTTLRVTPRLIGGADASIQLAIDIEDGQIEDRQVDALPTVRRSTVSTEAIVRQGETLVIAGHASDQNVESVQKIPGLGDLPGVGVLFANKTRSVQKRERLFMIRPRLVGMPGAPRAEAVQPTSTAAAAPGAGAGSNTGAGMAAGASAGIAAVTGAGAGSCAGLCAERGAGRDAGSGAATARPVVPVGVAPAPAPKPVRTPRAVPALPAPEADESPLMPA